MSSTAQVAQLPLPPAGEIVTQEILTSLRGNTLTLARGFAGTSDPTVIWQQMITDSNQAFYYYRELEEKDDDVSSALDKLKLSVLRRARQLTPADDSSEAVAVKDFVQQQLDRVPNFHQFLDAVLDAPGYGVSIAEMIWDVSAGQVGISDIHDCPQEMFSFAEPWQPQVGQLRFSPLGYSAGGGELVPEEKFVIFSYRPRTRNRRGRPLLRRVFWPSWFKRNTIRFWLRFGEKGSGTIAVQYAQGAQDDEQKKALAAAEAIVEKIAVAVPENFKIIQELMQGARSQNPAVFKALYDEMKYSIARRILGQTLTSFGNEGGTGSRALGDVHQDVEDEISVELARALEAVINDQLIRRMVIWNFGPMAPMPKWSLDKERKEDLAQRSQTDLRLQQMGVPIPLTYARETYGVPEPAGEEDVLQPRAVPAAIGGMGQPPQFSESERRRQEEDARRLLAAMRADALDVFQQRVDEIVDDLAGGVR